MILLKTKSLVTRLITGMLALVMVFSNVTPVSVLAYDLKASEKAASEDCRTWRQSDVRWGDYPIGASPYTLSDSGCYIFASLVALKLAGFTKPTAQPVEFTKFLYEHGCFGSSGCLTYNPVYEYVYASVGSDKHICYRDESFYSDLLVGKTTWKDKINTLSSAGYYVIIYLSHNHFVLALGQDEDGDVLIYDAGGSADMSAEAAPSRKVAYKITDQYSYEGIGHITIIDMDGIPLNEVKEYCGGNPSEDAKNSPFSVKDIRAKYGEDYWVSTYGLAEEVPLSMMNSSSLTANERLEISDWNRSLEYQKEDKMNGLLRAIVMLCGIVVVVYSTLLFLAFQVDRVNNFIDISLVSTMTFGLMMVADDGQSTYASKTARGEPKMLTLKDVTIASISGIAVGVLLLSGKLFGIIDAVITFFSNLLDKI